MSTLIVYSTKNGTTEKCANMLAEKLHTTNVVNVASQSIDIDDYETIVIGSCIRFGKILKPMENFLSENLHLLLHKQIALFICCGFQNQAEQHFIANFPEDLLYHAVTKQCFGGELDPNNLKGFDRFVTKIVMKSTVAQENPKPHLLLNNIDELAKYIH
ncbi:flavodoxin domain-containing protein [Bacillus massiliigorillae]|uniref:flavodoxin domain-containing protein n=1 Tax=Bacillus massiliigorillae TaxID=1243664 RepID=UPI0003A48589|nr:flavodoxin domain-containing protein [Bacillus massiliigorillae]